MQRYSITIIFLLLLLLPGLMLRRKCERSYRVAVFNTVGEIRIWGRDEQSCQESARRVIAVWQQLHQILNRFAPDSELSQLNRQAADRPFLCSDALWEALLSAREVYDLTDGAFDISISPLMRLWGFNQPQPRLPTGADIAETLRLVGLSKIRFNDQERSLFFTQAGMALDFGGLAKGFALDKAREVLRQSGQDCYMLNLGGNIYCSDKLPPGQRKSFQIGIRDPRQGDKVVKILSLRGQFISTSANYERGLQVGEQRIGHIIDPHTGYPGADYASVTVATSRGSYSDAFSTAVFVGGPRLARKLSVAVPGTSFDIFPQSGGEDGAGIEIGE